MQYQCHGTMVVPKFRMVTRGERGRGRSAAFIAGGLVLLSPGSIVASAISRSMIAPSCFIPSASTSSSTYRSYAFRRCSISAVSSPRLRSSISDDADEGGGSDQDSHKSLNEDDGLTAQERILRSAGLSPESSEERFARLQRRIEAEEKLKAEKRINIVVAVLAFIAALLNYAWNFTHPVTPVQVLAEMQSTSAPLNVIGKNGKPTVVDFWAPWCENCKMSAPTLQAIEKEYEGKVNFVMVNADAGSAWSLVERFGVDAIPHLAMISAEGDVETALIGPIPRGVLRAYIDALLDNAAAAAKGGNGACNAESNTEQEGTSVGSVASSTMAVAGSAASEDVGGVNAAALPTGVILPYDVPNSSTSAGAKQQTPFAECKKQKGELPYVMLDVFRNRPEMRRVNF